MASYLQQAECVRRKKQKSEKKNTKKSAPSKTHHEIHSRPATATNSRRRTAKHVPRVSPQSHPTVRVAPVGPKGSEPLISSRAKLSVSIIISLVQRF